MLRGIPTASYGDLPASAFSHETGKGPASESSTKKKRRTIAITMEDMQKRRNDAKERTTLLLALPNEHQLRFKKYETAKELWEEQIDARVAREMEEKFARENQRLSEQVTSDSKIARIHAEKELKMKIEGLDRSNEVIAKHLSEYEQAKADLSVAEKIELISELVKYQDHHAKILKYQTPAEQTTIKEGAKGVLHTKHFRGMTLEQIKEKFIPVWKQWEDFVPMSSKEESKRVKRPGLQLDQGSSKRVKISHTSGLEPSQEQQFKGSKGVSEEELKGMMQLVPLEEVYIEALQSTRDKENEPWVELKRMFKPNSKDQLWTYDQAFMHDALDWKLYDTCGVHHVSTKNQEIFMLVEKDYPLRKGLASVMISNKLQESLLGFILYRTLWPIKGVLRYVPPVNRKFSTGRRNFPTAHRKFPTASRKFTTGSTKNHTTDMGKKGKAVKPSAYWTWNPSQELSNKDSECIVLGRNFKLLDDTNILLRTPRQHNIYSMDLNNIVPHKDLTCLVAKASADECILWHRRLGHLNVKTMNKLVRHNLVRGLPTKSFDNDHTCTACLKGKQHKAS
nr:ribonuclease H-like domain-containing protein [Tanacetum cinerariifolium]